MITIRKITEDDAAALLELSNQLDRESSFMLFEPNERDMNLDQQRNMIRTIIHSQNSNIFVACDGDRLIGHLTVIGGSVNRVRHRAYLVIGILAAYTGQGIGSRLFNELENWRKATYISRIELTVMVHNENAISLYKKMGFEIEGIKRKSLIVDGEFVDEYYMGKTYLWG